MANITLGGNPIHTIGTLPAIGSRIPDFKLVKSDLSVLSLDDLKGKKVIFNIFPSLDTATCATSVRQFNAKAAAFDDTVVVCVSKDLPFAHNRFCVAEGIKDVITASAFRDDSFGREFGVTIIDSVFQGLLSRSVVVVDENGTVQYTEQVPETANEPNYEAALSAVQFKHLPN